MNGYGDYKLTDVKCTIVGVTPATDEWKKMYAAWDACQRAGIAIPDEVRIFFDGMPPENGRDGSKAILPMGEHYETYGHGYTLLVSDIPKDVTVIRFMVSRNRK